MGTGARTLMMKLLTPMMTNSFMIFCFVSVIYVSLLGFVYLYDCFFKYVNEHKRRILRFSASEIFFW